LEEQGLELHIFSLKRPADSVAHAQTRSVRAAVSYLPERFFEAPVRVCRGLAHVSARCGKPWRRAMRHALRRARADRDLDALWTLCQACCLVREIGEIQHLHAHYANIPARLALMAHRLTGVSYSITTHAKDIFMGDPLRSPKLHERISRARFVVANSDFSAAHVRAHVPGQAEIHTIHNGLHLETFLAREEDAKEPLILSVGRLVEKKGFADLISACRILKERRVRFTCELVGTGKLSQTLKDHIRQSGVGDCVRLIGPLPQEVLREHYQRAMVFALACVEAADGDRDILPNVIKEAMAIGVPVVTTRLDGIEELIEDEVSGLLVAPRDTAALAARLEALLGDARLRQRLSIRGRRVIEERFDRRSNFSRLKTLLVNAAQAPHTETERTPLAELNSHDASCLH
jgi:glycosyltransferase involved in cell wall biosynthesis